jgi:hypothetical protein
MCRLALPLILSAMLLCPLGVRAQENGRHATEDISSDRLELPAGGLVLVPDDRLPVESEEIVLARDRVRITYTIRNHAEDPLTRVVAWPLPEIDMNAIADGRVELPNTVLRNFVRAEATAAGARVTLQFEARASAFARDLTPVLQEAGSPLHPMAPGLETMLKALPAGRLSELEERGAILRDEGRVLPNWTFKTTAFWRQTFEPGKSVAIGLTYQPVVGGGPWRPQMLDEWRQAYCIDKKLEAEIASRLAKSRKGVEVGRLSYTVGNEPGWWAPVPTFRLAIEKPHFDTLVATCWANLRPAGPTLLVSTRPDFKPDDDIRVLFID